MSNKAIISAAFIVSAISTNFTHAAGFEIIVPHRAVYDINLDKASDRSGIKSMKGRIVYEVRGNECEGISLKYRFLTRVKTAKDEFISDQHTSTFESSDGNSFNFLTKSFLNEQLEKTIKGHAKKTGSGIKVSLDQPIEQEFDFSQAQFLTAYLVKLIELAKNGEHFYRQDLFDGSDGGDEVVATSSVISNEKTIADSENNNDEKISKQFEGMLGWSVSMSYFDKKTGATAEHLPLFETSFLLFENGISTDMVMRYPDYSLRGKLSDLELFEHKPCKSDG